MLTEMNGDGRVSRRSVLVGLGALLSAGSLPIAARAQDAARVVIVGGGWGGISAARNVKALLPNAQVTMVEPNAQFMSCPLSIHYIVGQRSADSLTFDYTSLTNDGIRHVQERAMGVDRDSKIVATATEELPYDFLVMSPGISYMEDAIPGFTEHKAKLPVGFRAFEQAAVKAALDAYEGGDIVLSVPPMPFRCPIAPYERAAMFAEWMNRNNKPGKLILLDQNPDIPIGKPTIEAAYSELYGDRIVHQKGIEFQSVNAETKMIETNAGSLSYGMASLVPPQQAGDIIRTAKLGGRFAPVKFPSFQSEMDEDVYVIGDSILAKLPKSGHLAMEAGIRVAEAIADRVAGQESDFGPQMPSAICFASFSESEAMAVNVTSEYDDFLEEMKVSPKVDMARSSGATGMANDWSSSVWDQLLG